MAKPPVSLPFFSHFAEVSLPFLQLAMCFFSGSSKKSKEQEEEIPLQEADASFPPFFFFLSLAKFVSPLDASVRAPELVIPEGVVGSVQAASFQTVQGVEGSLAPTGGDTSIGKTPCVAALDPVSRLSTFLAHFDLLEFNSLPASHFHRFGPSYGTFLRFSVPMEGLPLLEGLFKRHGDFTSGFKGGVFLGNIMMELLCVVLISLKGSSLDSLSEEKLLEWREVVQDLLEAKLACLSCWSTCVHWPTRYSRGKLPRALMLRLSLLRKL